MEPHCDAELCPSLLPHPECCLARLCAELLLNLLLVRQLCCTATGPLLPRAAASFKGRSLEATTELLFMLTLRRARLLAAEPPLLKLKIAVIDSVAWLNSTSDLLLQT